MVMLSVHNLCASVRRKLLLKQISTDFRGGELVGIIGPNGAGKSSLLRAILGLLPSSGDITLNSHPITMFSAAEKARNIAYLPQGQMLHWPLTVERLVALGRLPHLGPFSQIGPADHAAMERAMERCHILPLRGRDASHLSGGERARVLLARALVVEAPLLFADEPLANLDPGHQLDVMALLQEEAQTGKAIVTVLHDLSLAARYCNRLILLHNGQIIADGPPEAVLTPENLEKVYSVRATVDFSGKRPSIDIINRA